MRNISIALVVPALNESRRLGATLDAIAQYVHTNRLTMSVIVADDGSTDSTADVAAQHGSRMPYLDVVSLGSQCGKGAAVRAGVLSATADIIGFSDADLSTPLTELPRLIEPLLDDYDIAIASRALPSSQVARPQPLYRRLGARIFRELGPTMVGLRGFPDSQCGFKFYRAAVARDLYRSTVIERWMFDVEVLRLAQHRGYRVVQVPVAWRNHPDSRLRLSVDTYRMLRDLIRIRLRFWQGAYGPPHAG